MYVFGRVYCLIHKNLISDIIILMVSNLIVNPLNKIKLLLNKHNPQNPMCL